MSPPDATIVVTPRDRFGYARQSLESIYQDTDAPFQLVYVDANSPKPLQRFLEQQSKEKGFELIRTDHYLAPCVARNLGAKRAKGRYIVFIENDCVVTPGWLQSLVRCADQTSAAMVSPLVCEGLPLHSVIHFAGGEVSIRTKMVDGKETHVLHDEIFCQGQKMVEARPRMKREETGSAEFHCMLMRRDFLEKMGYFDESIVSKELVDACLNVKKLGGRIYFEPGSLVSFMSEPPLGPPLEPMDIPYYLLRWSDEWELSSLHRIRDKWGLSETEYFPARYQNLGWRRRMFVVKPFSRKLTFGKNIRLVDNLLYKLEAWTNRWLVRDYEKKQARAASA